MNIYQAFYNIGLFFITLAAFFLAVNYLIYGEHIYRIPKPIYSIMVYNNAGLPVYTRRFIIHGKNILKTDEMLITGALTAISTLIKESLGEKATLNNMNVGTYQIVFLPLPNNQGMMTAILLENSYHFQKSLERFIALIPAHVINLMDSSDINTAEFAKLLEPVIIKIFPYLVIQE